MRLIALILLLASSVHAAEPLKTAWAPLLPGDEIIAEREAMTSAMRYQIQEATMQGMRKFMQHPYVLQLRVVAVIERRGGVYGGLTLVHGKYEQQEYRDLFGKYATIGIWTHEHRVANNLRVNQRFDLVGKVSYVVTYMTADFDRTVLPGVSGRTNVAVAFCRPELTGFVRDVRVIMLSPKLVPHDNER